MDLRDFLAMIGLACVTLGSIWLVYLIRKV